MARQRRRLAMARAAAQAAAQAAAHIPALQRSASVPPAVEAEAEAPKGVNPWRQVCLSIQETKAVVMKLEGGIRHMEGQIQT